MKREQSSHFRIFRLKHALHCNPAVGPSLIQHWAKQGYLLHGKERHGSVERLTFSFPELVYLSLVVRLSWFGALMKDTAVQYPSRKLTDTEAMERTIAEYKGADPDFQIPIHETKLVTPKPILDILNTFRWDMLVTIVPFQVKIAAPSSRSKQIEIRYGIRLYETRPGGINVNRTDFPEAIVFIDAQQIHDGVKSALGIS